MRNIRILLLTMLLVAGTLFVPKFVYAECEHEWQEALERYYSISDTEHQQEIIYVCTKCHDEKTEYYNRGEHRWELEYEAPYVESISSNYHGRNQTYRCADCYEEKEEVLKKNHSWEYQWTEEPCSISSTKHRISKWYSCTECNEDKYVNTDVDHTLKTQREYEYSSSTQHKNITYTWCTKCDNGSKKTVKENHTFNKYDNCSKCGYIKSGTRNLKWDTRTYGNKKTWFKVNVPKKGYLILYKGSSSNQYDYSSVRLYNSTKKRINDIYIDNMINYIPVSRGVYYFKVTENEEMYGVSKANIKVGFKIFSAQNFSKKTALTVKRDTKTIIPIYSTDKKWKRYYKIKLTKKQYVRVYDTYDYNPNVFVINGSTDFVMRDSKGRKISFDGVSSGGFVSKRKLNKGTYYIELSSYWNVIDKKKTTGECHIIKWK